MRLREAKWFSKDRQNGTARPRDGHLENEVPVPERSSALSGPRGGYVGPYVTHVGPLMGHTGAFWGL